MAEQVVWKRKARQKYQRPASCRLATRCRQIVAERVKSPVSFRGFKVDKIINHVSSKVWLNISVCSVATVD